VIFEEVRSKKEISRRSDQKSFKSSKSDGKTAERFLCEDFAQSVGASQMKAYYVSVFFAFLSFYSEASKKG